MKEQNISRLLERRIYHNQRKECRNWRGITLYNTITKVLATIILNKISPSVHVKLRNELAGYCPNRKKQEQITSAAQKQSMKMLGGLQTYSENYWENCRLILQTYCSRSYLVRSGTRSGCTTRMKRLYSCTGAKHGKLQWMK